MRLRYSREALDDLDDACDWTGLNRSERQAERLSQVILDAIDDLLMWPERGRQGRMPGTRKLVVPRIPFFVVYRLIGRDIRVLAIFHQSRAWPPR